MVLAEQKLIPRTFAAVVRPITAIRSLVAFECGAVGPGKDCAYENVILKAITGYPMALEGKTAACAHFSPVGNIASATCDVWSNESIQNIKLLAGMAPTCCLDQLIYDCRLMNQASASGHNDALKLQSWLINSDAALDPQAYVLTPENSIAFGRTIVDAPNPYEAGKSVALQAVEMIRKGVENGYLKSNERELMYLDIIEAAVEEMPDNEEDFIAEMMNTVDTDKFIAADYGLE